MTEQEKLEIMERYPRSQMRATHLLWAEWLEKIGEDPSTLRVTGTNYDGSHNLVWDGRRLGSWNYVTGRLHIAPRFYWDWTREVLVEVENRPRARRAKNEKPMTLRQLIDWLQTGKWQT